MWTAVVGECGRVYFHNRTTDEVSWENPLRRALRDTQEFAEDLAAAARRRALRTAVHVGVHARVATWFGRWRVAAARPTRVRPIAHALDAWMRARDALKRVTHHRDTLLEELAVERVRSAEAVAALIGERVRRAEEAFDAARRRAASRAAASDG